MITFKFIGFQALANEQTILKDKFNLAYHYLQFSSHHRFSSLVDLNGPLIEAILAKEDKKALELLESRVKALYLDSYMDSARKWWAPGAFEGSQSNNTKAYRALINSISSELDAEEAEYDE